MSAGQLKGETNTTKKKRNEKEQEQAFYIYILNVNPHRVERQAVEGRENKQKGRQGEGKRTRRETERVEEEARASARELKVRWTSGPRAQPPSDLGP